MKKTIMMTVCALSIFSNLYAALPYTFQSGGSQSKPITLSRCDDRRLSLKIGNYPIVGSDLHLADMHIEGVYLQGPLDLSFAYSDEDLIAKIVAAFSQGNKTPVSPQPTPVLRKLQPSSTLTTPALSTQTVSHVVPVESGITRLPIGGLQIIGITHEQLQELLRNK